MGSLIVEFEDWETALQNTVSAPLQEVSLPLARAGRGISGKDAAATL